MSLTCSALWFPVTGYNPSFPSKELWVSSPTEENSLENARGTLLHGPTDSVAVVGRWADVGTSRPSLNSEAPVQCQACAHRWA